MADRAGAVQYANIDANTIGATTLVPGQAGMVAVLINMVLITVAANLVEIEDTGVTRHIGPLSFAANGGISMPDSSVGWMRSSSGRGIAIRLSVASRVAGSLAYRMVPDHMEF